MGQYRSPCRAGTRERILLEQGASTGCRGCFGFSRTTACGWRGYVPLFPRGGGRHGLSIHHAPGESPQRGRNCYRLEFFGNNGAPLALPSQVNADIRQPDVARERRRSFPHQRDFERNEGRLDQRDQPGSHFRIRNLPDALSDRIISEAGVADAPLSTHLISPMESSDRLILESPSAIRMQSGLR